MLVFRKIYELLSACVLAEHLFCWFHTLITVYKDHVSPDFFHVKFILWLSCLLYMLYGTVWSPIWIFVVTRVWQTKKNSNNNFKKILYVTISIIISVFFSGLDQSLHCMAIFKISYIRRFFYSYLYGRKFLKYGFFTYVFLLVRKNLLLL